MKQPDDTVYLRHVLDSIEKVNRYLRERYPSIPWHDIVRMRSKLVHDYFGVHLPTVYSTAVNDLPPLEAQVQA